MNLKEQLNSYNVVFDSQSRDAGESMPLGGHDVGCNVWVENGELMIYAAQSGAFDEAGNMVKAGRIRVGMEPGAFTDTFRQELELYDGCIHISGTDADMQRTDINLWVDVKYGALHVGIVSDAERRFTVAYENWRIDANPFGPADEIFGGSEGITFRHINRGNTHFWDHVHEEGLESIADRLPDVQKNLIFGGYLSTPGMIYAGSAAVSYAGTAAVAHRMVSEGRECSLVLIPHLDYSEDAKVWETGLADKMKKCFGDTGLNDYTRNWWHKLWERSHVFVRPGSSDTSDEFRQVGRNYQLFRYMLACNAYGTYPTKFNGGLFTIDPSIWGARFGARNPDERDWGGIVFTAQNQRLVYWPMLKNGDTEMMKPQFDFYFRLLDGAKARSGFFFGVKDAACIPEQTDANGMSAYYGLNGLDYPIHVRYHYITSIEFGYMMLDYLEWSEDENSAPYIGFIDTILNFYDQKYAAKDAAGKRIIFPSTAQETYHKAGIVNVWGQEGRFAANYNEDETAAKNPADVIYALHAIISRLLAQGYGTEEQRDKWKRLMDELPPVPLETKKGHLVIAPCEEPKQYVKTNCEFPQLYAAYPYHEIGIGRSNNRDLQLARDTYFYAWDEEDQLMNLSWMYVGVLAARLGLTDEAVKYQVDKLKDSGRRFPAFWGPGFDYPPDHNHGGCGMIGIQEMLMQTIDGKIYLLPAWPEGVDVSFKLWVERGVYVEAEYIGGRLTYSVSDESRAADIVLSDGIGD